MSIEVSPAIRRGVVFAVVIAIAALPAHAAQVEFLPVLTFGVFHTGNVLLVGYDPVTGQPSPPVSDDVAAIAFDLVWERKTPDSSLSFLYQPSYVKYRQRSELDYLGNTVGLSYQRDLSRKSTIQATFGALRTDFQGITSRNADLPATYVPRTTITRIAGAVEGTVGAARSAILDWQVTFGINRYEDVPNVNFNNSTSVTARGGWEHELGERSTLGLEANVEWFGYEVTPDYVAESLVLSATHKPGRYTEMTFSAGAARATSTGVSTTSAALRISLDRELNAGSRLNLGVRQAVTPGTGLQAATRDSGGWISYASETRDRGLGGQLDGAYWYRELLQIGDAPNEDTATLHLSGSLTWTFNRYVSVDLRYAFVDQTARGGASSALDTRYSAYGVYLRWAIKGTSGLSRRDRRLSGR